jgi:Tol biopolymer transport system component
MNRTLLFLGACVIAPAAANAQYFGRNAVQYETFNFKILKTQHFDVYFYEREAGAAEQAARMAERWYARLSVALRHELRGRQPLILYADHPDFEQTNVIGQQPGEGTGGVTESFKRRIILPMGASLRETDHVIGHELVHAFQYDIAGVTRGAGVAGGLERLPLWFVEGMAEYLSVGPVDPNTTMWMRDAVRRNKLPKLDDLADPEYFPYRWGQSFWAFVGGTYGDDVVGAALRAGGKSGNVRAALTQVTGQPADSLVAQWHRALRTSVEPIAALTGDSSGARVLVAANDDNRYNIAPALSPDGRRLVYLADDGLFSIDLYLADAQTGRTIRKLVSSTRDPHLESMQFINSAGAWDPEGSRFVFGAVVTGQPALRIVNGSNGDVVREIKFPTLGEIFNPTWSPDGNQIAFTAQVGGVTDLFVHDLGTGRLQRITNDVFADLEPVWSPDGGGATIAFVTDRFGTSLDRLAYGNYRLALVDVQSGAVTELPGVGDGKHINPQWTADGRGLFFLADPGGITNVYRLSLDGGVVTQVTNLFTGVSGITPISPALSVALKASRAVFSVYENGGYALHVMDDEVALAGGPLIELPATAAVLPPGATAVRPGAAGGVAALIADDTRGLPPATVVTTPAAVSNYRPSLSLDLVAQPSLAVAADRFGTYIGGGVTLFWSDMLGDHNLVTMAQLNGNFRDFAGLVAYENRRSRWNWSVAAQQIPYVTGAFASYFDDVGGQPVLVEEIERFRQTQRQVTGIIAYPFNRSRRFELSAGAQHISYSHELERRAVFQNGAVAFDSTIDFDTPDALMLGVGSAALVHDNSFHGATSPLLGDRWRLEVSPTVGSLQFFTALADYRRYLMPVRPFTLAGRVLHLGRYGRDADDERMYPLFLGYPSLVRGYDIGSFDVSECEGGSSTSCPVFDQLIGSRMLVGNVELRFPPFGLLGLGGGYYGILPLEAALFYDAGVAWNSTDGADFAGDGSRRFVTSAGVSLRMNLFGYAIGQMDFVRPFERPAKGWMIRFSLTPGF